MTIPIMIIGVVLGGIVAVFAFLAVELVPILLNRRRRERMFERGVVHSIKSALKAA